MIAIYVFIYVKCSLSVYVAATQNILGFKALQAIL